MVEVEIAVPNALVLPGSERGPLDVRQHRGQFVRADRRERRLHRPLLTDHQRRRHQCLDLVRASLGDGRGDRCAAEIDDPDVASDDDEVPVVQLAVGDSGRVEGAEQLPQLGDDGVVVERNVRLRNDRAAPPEDEQGVVLDRRAGGDDAVGGHARLSGKQCQKRLVLDLLEPSEPQRRSCFAVPDGAPQRRHQSGIVGVAPVHLDDEAFALAVRGIDHEEAGLLTIGRPEPGRRNPELGERRPDEGETGTPCARTKGEVGDRRGDDGDQPTGEGAERQAGAEGGDGERSEDHDPRGKTAHRSGEVRRHRQHGGAEDGNAWRRIPRRWRRCPQGVPDRRPRPFDDPTDEQPHPRCDEDRDDDVAGDRPAFADDHRNDEHDGDEDEQVGGELPASTEEARQGVEKGGDGADESGARDRREADQRQHHGRRYQDDDVAGPPSAWLVLGSGEQARAFAQHIGDRHLGDSSHIGKLDQRAGRSAGSHDVPCDAG